MKAWFPVASLVMGFALGFALFGHFDWQLSVEYATYVSVAALVGLDTVFGGIRAGIEGRFQNDIFVSGFLLNTILAVGLAMFGARIGVPFALVTFIVLGSRIFLNLSLIRRYFLNKQAMARSRQQEEAANAASAAAAPAVGMGHKTEIGGI